MMTTESEAAVPSRPSAPGSAPPITDRVLLRLLHCDLETRPDDGQEAPIDLSERDLEAAQPFVESAEAHFDPVHSVVQVVDAGVHAGDLRPQQAGEHGAGADDHRDGRDAGPMAHFVSVLTPQ